MEVAWKFRHKGSITPAEVFELTKKVLWRYRVKLRKTRVIVVMVEGVHNCEGHDGEGYGMTMMVEVA